MEKEKRGRPTKYNDEILRKAQDYLDNLPEGESVHSVEGLSLHLDIRRSTLYEWRDDEDKAIFSDIFDKILTKQSNTLINRGLEGKFNSTITKVMLTKHGYRDSSDVTSNGQTILAPQDREEADKAIDQLLNGGN